MRDVLGVAYLTVKESLRKRSFQGIVFASILSIFFSRILMEFSLQDLTKVFIDFSYSLVSFFLLVSALFISVDTMSKDIDKKAVYVILAQGLTREKYILGRSLGLFTFLLLFTLAIGIVFVFFTKGINVFTPESYRKDIYLFPAILAMLILFLKAFLLSCVVLFLSTFMSSFFLVFLTAVVILLAGSSVESLYHFVSMNKDKISPIVRHSIELMFYTLPNFSSLGSDVILGRENLTAVVVLKAVKSLVYSAFLVSLSIFTFRRRELL